MTEEHVSLQRSIQNYNARVDYKSGHMQVADEADNRQKEKTSGGFLSVLRRNHH